MLQENAITSKEMLLAVENGESLKDIEQIGGICDDKS